MKFGVNLAEYRRKKRVGKVWKGMDTNAPNIKNTKGHKGFEML